MCSQGCAAITSELAVTSHCPCPQPLPTTDLFSVSMHLPLPDISHQQSRTKCTFLCLTTRGSRYQHFLSPGPTPGQDTGVAIDQGPGLRGW